MSVIVDVLSSVIPVIAGGAGLTKAFVLVREGELAVRLRGGRFRGVVGPGLHFVIPGYDTLLKKNVRLTNRDIPSQAVVLQDGTAYTVQATVLYRIADLKHALLEVTDVDYTATHAAQAIVREVVGSASRHDLLNSAEINERLGEKATPLFESWGLKLEKFLLSDVEPTPGTAALLLREAEAEMSARTNQRLLESIKEQEALIRRVSEHDGSVVASLLLRGSAAPTLALGPGSGPSRVSINAAPPSTQPSD
jgi:regulator of protease activity HflC (stomatin/prohibitin superfamily)